MIGIKGRFHLVWHKVKPCDIMENSCVKDGGGSEGGNGVCMAGMEISLW